MEFGGSFARRELAKAEAWIEGLFMKILKSCVGLKVETAAAS
jgi:hypothetical protein